MAMKTSMIEAEVATWPEIMREDYRLLVESGQSPAMAQMLVSRRAPRINGEMNVPDNGRGYEPLLARFPGDPLATKGQGEGRSRFKKAAAKLAEKPRRDMSKPIYRLHPSIVERRRRQMIAENPSLARKDQRELREAIVEKHGSKKGTA